MPESIHPYFIAKARQEFRRAGGDPDLSGPLAEWAQTARAIPDDMAPPHGVIVAEDGEIITETFYVPSVKNRAGAAYIRAQGVKRFGLDANVLDRAMGRIAQDIGKRVVHIKYSQVCMGAGEFAREA